MKNVLVAFAVFSVGIFELTLAATAFASPSTSDYMNALTVCGLGMNLSIDADLAGSVKSLYDGAETKGKGYVSIEPALKAMVAHASPDISAQIISQYTNCIKETLALK